MFVNCSWLVHDLDMACSWLNFFMTCSWLVCGLVMACSWVSILNLFLTSSWLTHHFLMTNSWLSISDLFMNCSWLAHDLFPTSWWLVHNLFKTCSWFVHSFFTTCHKFGYWSETFLFINFTPFSILYRIVYYVTQWYWYLLSKFSYEQRRQVSRWNSRSSRSPFRRLTGTTIMDRYFRYSFLLPLLRHDLFS